MSIKSINEAFERHANECQDQSLKESSENIIDELRRALYNKCSDLQRANNYDLKAYEIAFQDIIEEFFPDYSWWEVCDLDIFTDLFANRNPFDTVEKICDSIKLDSELGIEEKPIVESPSYEMSPVHDSRKSFYGKARVDDSDGVLTLYSYNTPVAKIANGRVELLPRWDESQTTLRHVKEFLRQNGFEASSLSQIRKTYEERDIQKEEYSNSKDRAQSTIDKLLKRESLKNKAKKHLKESWTDAYNEFIKISDRYLPDTDTIEEKVSELYDKHRGESEWDQAFSKWKEETYKYLSDEYYVGDHESGRMCKGLNKALNAAAQFLQYSDDVIIQRATE